jgi:hypothetical protein
MPRRHSAERDWLQPSAPREGIITTIVVTCHWTLPTSRSTTTHAAIPARRLRSTTCGRLYLYDTLLERLPQDLEDMASELEELIEVEIRWCASGPSVRRGTWLPAINPTCETVGCWARRGRMSTAALASVKTHDEPAYRLPTGPPQRHRAPRAPGVADQPRGRAASGWITRRRGRHRASVRRLWGRA